MKGNKHGFRRALAILLSVMLLVSGPGLTVFADEAEEDVTIQPDESPTEESGGQTINEQDEDEPAGAEDETSAEDTFVEEQPVSVVFHVMPQTAEVTVYPASAGEASASEAIRTQEDGSFLLFPGDYTCTVRAEGYVSVENAPFTVTGDEEPMQLSFELEAEEEEVPEPEAFDRSGTENDAITSWSDLKTALAAGGEVILTQDLTAGADDSTLTIPSGVTVTLDLNGHTLGPGPVNDDKVIHVRGGTLLLKGDGTITGGNRCRYGIFVESYGTFTMDGGTVTEVTVDGVRVTAGTFTMNGGAIMGSGEYGVNALNAAFTMNGGEITGSQYMGVEIEQSTFTMNGGRISDSYDYDIYFDSNDFYLSGGTVSGEIFLSDNSRIVITSRLDPDDCYNIVMQTNGVFTSGLNGKGDLSNFRSADYPYTVALNGQGEAMLVPRDTVVPYVERSWDGEKVVSKVTSRNNGQWQAFPDDANITSGWYYLNHDVTKNGRIESITGDVNLILGDGNTLDVKGLYVPPGSTLSIYGQTAGTGRIYSHPSGGAAIGGYSNHDNGNIVIHSGTVEANGYDHCAGIGSNDGRTGGSITIYGGDITANGGSDGAGIGGGRDKSGGNITIYGGDITAKGGGTNGAAIGGGKSGDGGSISIYGGTVTTSDSPNENGAGIGGGDSAAGGTITISGGTIKAYSRDGAGIGGGDDGSGGNITISGGEIYSYSANQGWGARIGGGAKSSSGKSPDAGTIIIEGGSITTTGGRGADIGGGYKNTAGGSVTINGGIINASGSYGIGGGEGGSNVSITMGYTDATKDTISVTAVRYGGTVTLNDDFAKKDTDIVFEKGTYTDTSQMAGVTLTAYVRPEVPYVDLAGEPQSEECTPVYATTTAWDNDWYAVTKNVEITGEITVTGDVNLILADGFSLTSKNIKVPAGSSLTIWGQSGGSGTIAAAADHDSKAGIGGAGSDCGTITINGGTVTAAGGQAAGEHGYGSAGIGGCVNKKTGTVIINRGTVTATGGKTAAGIGGGGIMPGYDSQISSAGRVEINGGTVTATGKAGGAGIGSGFLCPSDGRSDGVGEILITGGTVNAYGSEAASGGGAGIGGGMKSQAGTITITGGTINAEGNEWSPAIGTGGLDPEELSDEACVGGTITITGGKVTANVPVYGDPDDVDDDSNWAAAIGGGRNGGGVTINISGGEVTAASGRIGMGYGYTRSDLPCTINLSWTEEGKDTMSVTSTSYYSPVNLEKAFRDKTDGTVFPAQNSVWNRLDGRTLVPYESEEQTPVVIIKSANVEFQGEIRLQFTLSFPESVLADEGACVTFEKAGKIMEMPVSEGIVIGDGLTFVIPVPAPEYADEITVKVYDGEDNQLMLKSASGTDYTADGFVYSVKQYARNKAVNGSTEEMRALAKALDNYGTAAQIYFQYGDYSGLSVDAAVTAVTLNDLAPYKLSTSGTRPAGVTGASIVVEFDTDNTLRITFKTDGSKALDDYTFLLDNVQTVPVRSGNNGYLLVENIAAPNLDISHTFTVTDGADTYTVTASALSYAYTSVKSGTEARRDLGKALYLYSQAADAMFGN